MYPIIRAKKRHKELIQKEFHLKCGDAMEYLVFPTLEEAEGIQHLFSTRMGGISKEEFATLNFSFVRGDDKECVSENYRRIAEIFGVEDTCIVTTHQTHTTNIRVVTNADAGKGVTVPRDYADTDGLITKEKGLLLSCFFADCVPLYFVDRVKGVIGLAHSGWRGTVKGMGSCMVKRMQEEFGCNPADILTGIGPSICQDCYEVSEEVAIQFKEGFWSQSCIDDFCKEAYEAGVYPSKDILLAGKESGKYQLDLWLANIAVLRSAGIPLVNISVTDLCTCCNAPYLFSHRATGGKRGNLGAFLMLKDE